MNDFKELANLIFPNIKLTLSDLEKRYPKRNLDKSAYVTRFAPSPTGFLHTGSLFTALISSKLAKDSNGVFFLRVEDTDTKREIKGSIDALIKELAIFNIIPDEGLDNELYGPYKQSERQEIYDTVLKHMIEQNLCYPAFDTDLELEELRNKQLSLKLNPGYYGDFAPYRNKTAKEYIELVKSNRPYILRFRSSGNPLNKIEVTDLIRGKLFLTENNLDIVIRKSDNLPTYHFAHVVDDHFMRTNLVSRGEEWLSSLPIHIELFDALGFEKPSYMHMPVIMKNDNGTRRKLSKRKDLEASVSYFIEEGYPVYGLLEYLLTIANSNYEEWREKNLDKDFNDFKLSFNKFSLDGALFDLDKIKNICKDRLSLKSADVLLDEVLAWSKLHDLDFYNRILANKEFVLNILGIDRNTIKPRKDYEKYSDIFPFISFMFADIYDKILADKLDFNPKFDKSLLIKVLNIYLENINLDFDQENDWFSFVQSLAINLGFGLNKDYKKDPSSYVGSISDFCEILRLSITTKKNSPSLFKIQSVLGINEVKRRLEKTIKNIEEFL